MSAEHLDLANTDSAKQGYLAGAPSPSATDVIRAHLEYKQPYDFAKLLSFFASRAIVGIEKADEHSYSRVVRIRDVNENMVAGWIRVGDDSKKNSLTLTASSSLAPVLSAVVAQVRRQFDLDCNPSTVADGLASMAKTEIGTPAAGIRLPGCFDAFETICRAILGQQISVKAANNLAARIANAYGIPVDTGIEGLACAWPNPQELLALNDLESAFGELGVIKNRTHAIETLATMLVSGDLNLSASIPFEEKMDALISVKGIGPWTANYIAMRVLGHPDAFLESDAGVAHALPSLSPKERLALAEQWRPWRSYAVIALWNSLG